MPHYNLRLPFPDPKIESVRPTPAPMRANFIAGDPQGLFELATTMYEYVITQSDHTVKTLARTVTDLVKDDTEPGGYIPGPDGGWIGETAKAFRDTFISEAAMANGLNSVICTVAKTADELAAGLSGLENKLESQLENNAANIEGFNLNWLAVGSDTIPSFRFTTLALPAVQKAEELTIFRNLLDSCNRIGYPFFVQADKLRHTAASQLVTVSRILEEAFSYYANYSASPGSPVTSDPSILLTSGQAASDSTNVKDLQTKYSQLAAKLNSSPLDEGAAKRVLKDLGIAADKSSAIIGGIKDIKDAKGVVGTGNKFLSFAGTVIPLLMAIGSGL